MPVPLDRRRQAVLSDFVRRISSQPPRERTAKTGQILSYLDAIDAQLRRMGHARPLVFVDCGAGNAYLSFAAYHYYAVQQRRALTLHCLDTDARLTRKARRRAAELGFAGMRFHCLDIADFGLDGRVDLVYALHACGEATDKALHLGLRQRAACMLSVACCQHGLVRRLHPGPLGEITRHRLLKERMAYMAGDALRALLLEMRGYRADVVEFAPARHTGKNTMLRARKAAVKYRPGLQEEYERLRACLGLAPPLERYLR